MESRRSSQLLAPGFRFHPTDEELVVYYLHRKIRSLPLRVDCISVIDIYKVEPWDLPGKSRLKTRDLEWYFFSVLDKKYGNGARTNRATEKGYWKTTGKDRSVYHHSQVVGMKKTLVYHIGRAPKGQRTNWVMHEYRRVDEKSVKSGFTQDAFVLCRVFQKSGAGPKNGEQYGAPFIAEEWEMDGLGAAPKTELDEELGFLDDICLDGDDIDQILGTETPINNTAEHTVDIQNTTGNENEAEPQCETQNSEEKRSNAQPIHDFDPISAVKHEYMGESSNGLSSENLDAIFSEPLMDGTFLETNDLSNPVEPDPSGFDMLEEYLNFQDILFDDPAMLAGSDELLGQPSSSLNKDEGDEASRIPALSKLRPEHGQHPFMKQASKMLGNIQAPPALASEFPKTGSVHVTAGLIQIRDLTLYGTKQDYNLILSFGSLESRAKSSSSSSGGWFCSLFWVLMLLSISIKVATFVYAR